MTNRRKIGAGACVAVLLLAGCGKIAEKSIDQAAQQATGCKDINAGNGSVNCKGVGVNINGDGKVPAGFPAARDPPAGSQIIESSTQPGSERQHRLHAWWPAVPGIPNLVHDRLTRSS